MTGDALDVLTGQAWYREQLVHVERQAPRPARHRRPERPLPDRLQAWLDGAGLEPYTHQAAVVDAARRGEDVVVVARTAAGKSLAYQLVVAEALLADPAATALCLFPTKALARDQLATLEALDAGLRLGARAAVYDGDTPGQQRARIRRESRLVVSNPYGLHEYLPQAAGWRRFLAGLAVVVVDESHRYRGVFGSHVAFVLRRLLRLCARLGARPTLVLASATVANPGEHAAALVGRPVTVVDDDGGPVGERTVALWDSRRDPARSAAQQAAAVVAALVRSGHATLGFTGSRVGAELVAAWAQQAAPGATVSPYRAGFTPAERRAVEGALKAGQLDAVVSTNALELGIDIGGLDAVVMAGYPGTVASLWQQAGRAGRAGRPSLAVLVAGDDPLDQYLVRRPATVFGAPVERAVVSLANPEVLAGQVLCAAAELPLDGDDPERFGPGYPAVVDALSAEGLLAPVPAGRGFCGTFRPAAAVRLDGRGEGSVAVRVDGDTVEVLEAWRAVREAHAGAILLHRGQRYQVDRLDLEAGVAEARPVDTTEHTQVTARRDSTLGRPDAERRVGPWRLAVGPVRIRQQVVGYRRRRGDEVLDTCPLDLPPVDLDTRGIWLVPDDPGALGGAGGDPLGALHAAEHGLIHAMPLLAMCDRGDVGGLATLADAAVGGPLVLLYDGQPGGAGIAEVAYDRFEALAAITADLVGSCDCAAGCPRCVYDRACGSDNHPMDRRGAMAVLAALG